VEEGENSNPGRFSGYVVGEGAGRKNVGGFEKGRVELSGEENVSSLELRVYVEVKISRCCFRWNVGV